MFPDEPVQVLRNMVVNKVELTKSLFYKYCQIYKVDSKVLSDELINAGITAYVDETEKSPGFKFAEAEVNGIPVRIEVGARDLENNQITFARRDTGDKIPVSLDGLNIVNYTKELLEIIQKDMYDRAVERRDKLTFEAHNLEEKGRNSFKEEVTLQESIDIINTAQRSLSRFNYYNTENIEIAQNSITKIFEILEKQVERP